MNSSQVKLDDLEVVAIGHPSTARNRYLANECLENGLYLNWTPPVVLNNSSAEFWTTKSKFLSLGINGRLLSAGEIGCALAHRSCYARHAEGNVEWMLILEDDATLSAGAGLVVKTLATLRTGPAIVLLFGNVGNPLTGSQGIRRLVRSEIFPSGAVGYLVNRSAAKIALEDKTAPYAPADFPPFQTKVDFYRTAGTSPVMEVTSKSMIGHQVFSKSDVFKMYLRKLAFGPLACMSGDITIRDWVSFALLRPFVRDLKGLGKTISKGRK